MVKVENDCVSCGLPCIFNSCPYYRVTRLICDKCGCETDTLYDFYGSSLCQSCVIGELDINPYSDHCDKCGCEDDVYSYDDKNLCGYCVLREIPLIDEEV